MATGLWAWSGRMGNLPIHIDGYNNEHDVFLFIFILSLGPFTLKRNPEVSIKTGSAVFSKVSIFDLENAGVV